MDRNGSNGGTPDHFQNDDEYATRHHIWVQRQETRHAFSRLETRLDDTFEEFRQQNARLQKQHDDNQGVLATMSAQVAQLFIRSNQRNSHASSSSRRRRSEAPSDANNNTPQRDDPRASRQDSSHHDPRASQHHSSNHDSTPRASHQNASHHTSIPRASRHNSVSVHTTETSSSQSLPPLRLHATSSNNDGSSSNSQRGEIH